MRKVRFGIGISPNIIIYEWIINIILFLFFIFSIAIVIEDTIVDVKTAMQLYGMIAIALIIKISITKKIVFLGPTYIILLYTIVSCFGYDILVFIDPEKMYETISSLRHAYTDYYNLANAYYYIGVFSFILGIVITKKRSTVLPEKRVSQIKSFSKTERKLYLKISLGIIYFYILWLLFEVITGRLPITNYFEIKDYFSQQSILMYLLRATWVAIPTYIFFAQRKDLVQFLIPVTIMFIILMFTGNRNEILYPLAISVGIYVWKRKIIENKNVPKYIIYGSLLLILVINPMISSSRQDGFTTLFSGSFGLEATLLEMGQQLNPFSIILFALDRGIYSFQHGMTIIVPTISLLSLNLFFGTEIYKISYFNPTNVLNDLGHYGRGFSYITEIFINFGFLGIFITFLILGRVCFYMESVCVNKKRLLFFFQIGTLFMLWSRNVLALNFVIIIFAIILQFVVEIISGNKKRKLKYLGKQI